MGVNLPEFKSCFGLFSLKTGVYIIAISGMIITGASIIGNCFIFFEFLEKRRMILDPESNFLQNNSDITDERIHELMSWTNVGFGYFAIWIVIKIIIFCTAVLLFYGVWKNAVRMFKIYLYINVPYWVVNCIIALIATYFFNAFYNILAVGGLLIDCCRLLIIRSAYREMTGKRRFLETPELPVNYQRFDNPPSYTPPSNPNLPHCNTCTCGASEVANEPTDTPQSPSDDRQLVPAVEVTVQKELNFKDRPCIYDERQLASCSSPIVEDSRVVEDRDEVPQKNFDERPIIFDQTQLSVGSSPIIEDHPSFVERRIVNSGQEVNQDSEVPAYPRRKKLKKRVPNVETGIKPERPTTLDLNSTKEKFNDTPTIYDVRQLNVGSCPVTEESI